MARVFITGSSDGLGLGAARQLVAQGHEVVLHARSEARARDARAALPQARDVVVGDFASIAGARQVATQANQQGRFDAVIHNAAVGYQERKSLTVDGLEHVFAINVLAPYVVAAEMERPARLIFLSSGMHRGGDPSLDDLDWKRRAWNGSQAYSDSKLFDTVLAFAFARVWPTVKSNSVDPGWVATKMGGRGAPDDPRLGADTQVWLAVSDDADAQLTGQHLFHRKRRAVHPSAEDEDVQNALLALCHRLSGTPY